MLLGSAASSQKPREKEYLKRIADKSDVVFLLQETHRRVEHLLNIDTVLDRAAWENVGAFTPGAILIRTDILGPSTSIEHEEVFPGRIS